MPTRAHNDLLLPFDYVQAKIQVPAPRPGSVFRTALVNRLRAARGHTAVSLVAPAGYGKTTLLAQLADRDDRAFAWVSLDERDNDPIVLMRHVAAALDGCEPLTRDVGRALRSPGDSIWTAAVPRLAGSLASVSSRTVLVLDNASRLHAKESVEVVETLAAHVPDGSTLVLSGRVAARLPVTALRTRGRLLEIGPELLALSRAEARALLDATGVHLTDEQLEALFERTEGWAAGLYLAALAIRESGEGAAAEYTGDDRYLADYFHSEYLDLLDPERLAFLRQTSLLGWMSGPLCDAMLGASGSAATLESIEDEQVFVVPLDRYRERYRYHRLLQDLLRREVERHEPETAAALHCRAAAWLEAHDEPDSAIRHAVAGGDVDRAARIVAAFALGEIDGGRPGVVECWLALFDDAALERHPQVAVIGAWLHALRGRPAAASHLLAIAERSGPAAAPSAGVPLRPCIDLVRAALCRDGLEQMLTDARSAAGALPAGSHWQLVALVLEGTSLVLSGAEEEGENRLRLAVEAASVGGSDTALIAALAEWALSPLGGARAAEEQFLAETLARDPRDAADATAVDVLAAAVSARMLLRRGRTEDARAALGLAQGLGQTFAQALPWLAVQSWLELARAHATLCDAEGARSLLDAAAGVLERRPGLGTLAAREQQLRQELASLGGGRLGTGSPLTSAELRLLPWLATHLSFREIGARLYVSRNTIKTQAISVYRKLGVSSRSEAIECAGRLGLLDADEHRLLARLDAEGRD